MYCYNNTFVRERHILPTPPMLTYDVTMCTWLGSAIHKRGRLGSFQKLTDDNHKD